MLVACITITPSKGKNITASKGKKIHRISHLETF